MTIWSASRRPGTHPRDRQPPRRRFFQHSVRRLQHSSDVACLLPVFDPDCLRNAEPGEQISWNEQRVYLGEHYQRPGIAYDDSHAETSLVSLSVVCPGERSRCPGCSGARRTRSSKARFSQPYRVTRRRCYRTDREGRAHACLDLGQRLAQMHQQGVWFVPLQDQNRRNASDGFFFSSRTLVVCIAAAPKVLPGLRCSPRTVGTEELSAPEQNRPRSPTRLR